MEGMYCMYVQVGYLKTTLKHFYLCRHKIRCKMEGFCTQSLNDIFEFEYSSVI